MGAQDSLDFANEFVSTTGTDGPELTMIWDESFETWRQLGIRAQPYWILYDAQGNEVTSRPGAVDIASIEATLTAS